MAASNSINDNDYAVVVMIENRGFPDDLLLSEFPQVSIMWEVSKSYSYIIETGTGQTRSKKSKLDTTTREYGPIPSLPSHDIISDMLHGMRISFPLNNLQLKTRAIASKTEKLTSVDDMISKIQRAVERMVVDGGGRKKLDVIVTVEQEIKIKMGQQQYEEMDARRTLEIAIRDLYSHLSGAGLLQHPSGEARDRSARRIYDLTRRSVAMSWNEIRSLAAAAGINMNNISNINSGGNYDNLVDINALLIDLGMLMEAMSLDPQALLFRPASKASVEALAKFWKIDGVEYGTNTDYCVVCLEMLSGEEVTCLPKPCSHMFHASCIVQWFKFAHTCPVCRFELPTD